MQAPPPKVVTWIPLTPVQTGVHDHQVTSISTRRPANRCPTHTPETTPVQSTPGSQRSPVNCRFGTPSGLRIKFVLALGAVNAREHADVAQLVAHHLAKVRVASSSLVIRSSSTRNVGAISSAVEHYLDTVGVTGSIPVSRTEGLYPLQLNIENADVAQLVAHHLAKVRVASSSLVIRSKYFGVCRILLEGTPRWIGRVVRQRSAKPCTRVRFPYPPPSCHQPCAISSAVEHYLDTVGVTGSIPVSRTRIRHRIPADVAQLVAHHLAKVRVASSSLVIRSTQTPAVWPGLFSFPWTLTISSAPLSTHLPRRPAPQW